MKTINFLLLLVVLILFSCETPERNNPYDPECPKDIWTPTNFQALQEGVGIKLTWNIPSANFAGFRITKRVNNGTIINLVDLPNNVNQFVDNNLIGGQQQVYNIYAYAGNNQSNSLSAQVTPILLASVSTASANSVTSNTAILGGSISTNNGATIVERGICYSLTPNPTTNNNKVIITGNNIGPFSNTITGLSPETTYYVKAYAINSQGTSYGEQISFSTRVRIIFNPNLTYGSVSDVDGNNYKIITIGTQTWMAENLKTTKYKNGISINNETNLNFWSSIQTGLYCWQNNDPATYKDTYGAFYNWYAVNSGNLCPNGWHIPTNNEWNTLITYLGGETVGKGKLKEISNEHWLNPNTGATNSSGFSAVPSGYVYGGFTPVGYYAIWWTATEANPSTTYIKQLTHLNDQAFTTYGVRALGQGYCVRCIMN
jgi:uncharacterized protein (TIGR02145 family)